MNHSNVTVQGRDSVLAANKMIRNTYTLLSMTLLFSAVIAYITYTMNVAYPGPLVFLVGWFGLLFITSALRNSAWGLVAVFAFTGFVGYMVGPIINYYITSYVNGSMLVSYAMTSTAVIFLGLSGYALTTRKDFSFMGGFLFAGIMVAFLAGVTNVFFLEIPALALAVSSAFVLLMAGLILYQTSAIVHGGETNYIMATITLFAAIFNLFMSLLHLMSYFMGER